MKSLKTPLRYPGGKSRVAKMLVDQMPDSFTEYREPFLGGGSVAIEFTKRFPDTPVWVNDKYVHLYNFWCQLQERGEELSDLLCHFKNEYDTPDKARELFLTAKSEIDDANELMSAVYFWIMNKCSYSGLTENSSFSPQASNQNFTLRGARRLPEYSELIQNWKITNHNYSYVMELEDSDDPFLFLDPPYDIKDFLYGGMGGTMHKGFDHRDFAFYCNKSKFWWMCTYNINENIERLFSDWHIEKFSITYGMQHRADNKSKQEYLITNYKKETVIEQLLND